MAFTIATYNVKDLFDAIDDAGAAHLNRKLDVLAGVVRTLDADVLALQEVSSEAVVDQLRQRLLGTDGAHGYHTRIVGTADRRGIACALLSRAPVRSSEILTADQLEFPRFHENDPSPFGARIPLRRGIVHAEIDAGPLGIVHALVLHFKSMRPLPFQAANGETIEPRTSREHADGELRTLVWRASEALFVRGVVDGLFTKYPDHHVVVTGDFNDVAGSTTLRIIAGEGETALESAAEIIPSQERFSIVHRERRETIDHMLLSSRLRSKMTQAHFFNENLRDHSLLEEHEYPTADSDHAPLVVRFQ